MPSNLADRGQRLAGVLRALTQVRAAWAASHLLFYMSYRYSAHRALIAPVALASLLAFSHAAHATNGYFSHGYGVKSEGIAGIGVALPQDGLAGAANPAGTNYVDKQLDVGLTWFAPKRGAEIVNNGVPGASGSYDGNGRKSFFIPEIGYVRPLSADWSFGLAVYGNGGMNTEYHRNPYGAFGAQGTAGVNLEQLFITPSVAWRVDAQNSLGVGLNLAYQRFSAQGIGLFSGFSSSPADVSDRGDDHSTGVGVRLGWISKPLTDLTLGFSWSSKIDGRFDKYRGLFADQGGFDIPSNYAVGATWQVNRAWSAAFEVQRINYSEVGSVGNPINALLAGVPLGASGGPGFGWRDVNVVKLGGTYALDPQWTLRAGYSHSTQPVPASQTFFNILAPGVVQNHLTLGATLKLPSGELSGFYAHGFKHTVNGDNSIPPSFGGGNADVHLEENILGVSYGWKF